MSYGSCVVIYNLPFTVKFTLRPYPANLFSVKHNWETMTEAIQNHIGSLNWSYRLSLREKAVAYVNSYGEFVEHHKIKVLFEYLSC